MPVSDRRWELEQRFAVGCLDAEPEQRALELEHQRGVPRGLGTILEGRNAMVGPREMLSGGNYPRNRITRSFLVGPSGLERQDRGPHWRKR